MALMYLSYLMCFYLFILFVCNINVRERGNKYLRNCFENGFKGSTKDPKLCRFVYVYSCLSLFIDCFKPVLCCSFHNITTVNAYLSTACACQYPQSFIYCSDEKLKRNIRFIIGLLSQTCHNWVL